MPEREQRLDIASPSLERFLGSAEERRFTADERLRRLRAIFGTSDPAPERALEELHPYRIMALWRMTRLVLEAKGRLSDDERLDDATATDPSPWEHPTKPIAQSAPKRGTGGLVARHMEDDGLPIICPSGPPALVERWCDATGIAAGILSLGDTERGQRGIRGILDPRLAPHACPTADQILAFEERMIAEAIELLVEHGEPATMDHYRTQYELTRREALTLVRLARALLLTELDAPVEQNRAVAIAMLKRFIEEVAETPNMRDRLLAIKELVRVQGVTREAPEDAMRDFLGVVRAVSKRREELEMTPSPQIGEGSTDAAFEVVDVTDEDRDALEAFDRESRE